MSTLNTSITSDLSIGQLGKPNGFCPLDATAKVPGDNLPGGVSGALTFIGGYDASINTPDLTNIAQQVNGNLYVVTVGGTQDIGNGSELFTVGDTVFWSTADARWYNLQGSVLAIEVVYDNTGTNIIGVNIQDAINELASYEATTIRSGSTVSIYMAPATGNDSNDGLSLGFPIKSTSKLLSTISNYNLAGGHLQILFIESSTNANPIDEIDLNDTVLKGFGRVTIASNTSTIRTVHFGTALYGLVQFYDSGSDKFDLTIRDIIFDSDSTGSFDDCLDISDVDQLTIDTVRVPSGMFLARIRNLSIRGSNYFNENGNGADLTIRECVSGGIPDSGSNSFLSRIDGRVVFKRCANLRWSHTRVATSETSGASSYLYVLDECSNMVLFSSNGASDDTNFSLIDADYSSDIFLGVTNFGGSVNAARTVTTPLILARDGSRIDVEVSTIAPTAIWSGFTSNALSVSQGSHVTIREVGLLNSNFADWSPIDSNNILVDSSSTYNIQSSTINRETITANKTLEVGGNIYQHIISNTASLLVNLPASPINGTHFVIKNSTSSSENFTTNSVVLLPGDIYEVKYDGTQWVEL